MKIFDFIVARIHFDEFLIDGDLQMVYKIQVFRNRFVFWHTDWLPKGYNVPPWSILSVKKENNASTPVF